MKANFPDSVTGSSVAKNQIPVEQRGLLGAGKGPQLNLGSRTGNSAFSRDSLKGTRQLPYHEYVKRRDEGKCYPCGGNYSPGHRCLAKNLQVLILGEDEVEEKEIENTHLEASKSAKGELGSGEEFEIIETQTVFTL